MMHYCIAGQEFYFSQWVPELAAFEINGMDQGTAEKAASFIPPSILKNELISQTVGWVAGAQRAVETWSASPGLLVRVAGGSDFAIGLDGMEIRCASQGQGDNELNEIDRQILLGPVLVLALALRGSWSMHASAAIFNDNLVLFLGESGQGKSTLAGYLASETGWRLVADDILPVTISSDGVLAWPHFPQLKLPVDKQPGPSLPEPLSISKVCVLTEAKLYDMPALKRLSSTQAIQMYLGHTAGTRLFDPEMLKKHLVFCSQAAEKTPVYRLIYPHRWESLRVVRELLESVC
jgi:hypothetical protein